MYEIMWGSFFSPRDYAVGTYHKKKAFENNGQKDTCVFDDDISGSLVEHHLIEDIDNLAHKLIILLLGWKTNRREDATMMKTGEKT